MHFVNSWATENCRLRPLILRHTCHLHSIRTAILHKKMGNKPRINTCSNSHSAHSYFCLPTKCCHSNMGTVIIIFKILVVAKGPNGRGPVSILQEEQVSWRIKANVWHRSRLGEFGVFAEPASRVLQCALARNSHALTGRRQTLYLVRETHSNACADGWRQGDDVTLRRQMCWARRPVPANAFHPWPWVVWGAPTTCLSLARLYSLMQ